MIITLSLKLKDCIDCKISSLICLGIVARHGWSCPTRTASDTRVGPIITNIGPIFHRHADRYVDSGRIWTRLTAVSATLGAVSYNYVFGDHAVGTVQFIRKLISPRWMEEM